ncbi:hypothetical protein [Autumnicola musiva]|uniref:Uncharacterized protein n=1 Tax=Autumnicola musiva TaxID=3075589 RepID=A0ABU3D654_9FLAO|nr:hypothetical protein [Zunongwangia sp. F117]MDT0677011.1 hypothetical protein [Zunongwangia sp. F117]
MKHINSSINELQSLCEVGVISMYRISWWLLKYENFYQNTLKEIPIAELPTHKELSSDISKFNTLYTDLISLENLKYKEKIFQQRFESYKRIKRKHQNLKNWMDINKTDALETYFDFWFEWTNEENNTLKPFLSNWNHLDITIPLVEFKNTVKVLKIFHEHYWEE